MTQLLRSTTKIVLLLLLTFSASAQDTAFGIKGGPLLGVQQWNNFQQDVLISYHGIVFVETVEEDDAFNLFAQAGYHVRGSALRNRQAFNFNGDIFSVPTQNFEFRNVSLTFGGKQKKPLGLSNNKYYYGFGVRGEYTINTNLKEYEAANSALSFSYYPTDFFVRKFNYGMYFAGGLEFPFSDLVGGLLEVSVNPDFSKQYEQPELGNIIDPFRPGQTRTIGERSIRNVSFEITLGIRFIRRVIVLD